MAVVDVPKAELHVHLEGAVPPATLRRLADRNGIADVGLPGTNGTSRWRDFAHFLRTYNAVARCFRSADDYRDGTRAYLAALAAADTLYAELTISPAHARRNGISLGEYVGAVSAGMEDARRRSGIEARAIVTAVRDLGPESAEELVIETLALSHPMVTGFGLAGDERVPARRFAAAFERAAAAGLGCTAHAGELRGPESVWEALELPVTRIGHGVRSSEDPELVAALIEREITLEVCPQSNIALGVYRSLAEHPLAQLRAAGVRVTLNSDDPTFFGSSLSEGYAAAAQEFGWSDASLAQLTRTAIEAAFCDPASKEALLAHLDAGAKTVG